ncbi:hypothetical protein [Microbacterium gorillae]|uniref:hypothetical protein n=1 Tax=Microbacterium gorillae TaxID=1231063 RepID=UPI003D98688D
MTEIGTSSGVRTGASRAVAAVAAALVGMRFSFGPGITLPIIAALLLLPVWWPALRTFRWARPLMVLGVLALVSGAVLSLVFAGDRAVDSSLLVRESLTLLSMLSGIGLLLWARTQLATSHLAIAFALGALVNVAITGGNTTNLWKFSLSFPLAFLALALAMRRSRWGELVVLGVVAVISVAADSRSFSSFALIAGALVLLQLVPPRQLRSRPWLTLGGLALLGITVFLVIQTLLVEGVLGSAAQQRTQAQLDASGSLITGGRPELGAAMALLGAQPLGYGSGTLPNMSDVIIAKNGMEALSYDPDNGYVDRYLFGGHFEVHSVLGDLWIRFGLPGALFALLLLAVAVHAAAVRVSLRRGSALLALLLALGVWDMFFSPLLTSYNTLALLLACALLSNAERARLPRAHVGVTPPSFPRRASDACPDPHPHSTRPRSGHAIVPDTP